MNIQLLTSFEVSKFLRVHPNTLRNWTKKGVFPKALKIEGRKLLWSEQEILDWVNSRKTSKPEMCGGRNER